MHPVAIFNRICNTECSFPQGELTGAVCFVENHKFCKKVSVVVKKLHRVRTFKNDPAEIISVSTAVLGRMHREVIFTRHSIAIIIHFSLETEKKIIRTTDTYLCLSVSSLWTNLASSRMCDWNRNSLPLF